MKALLTLALLAAATGVACAQDDDTPEPPEAAAVMSAERLGELVQRIDEDAVQQGPSWLFVVDGLEAMLVYDTSADRMRVMIPINDAGALPPDELERLCLEIRYQANRLSVEVTHEFMTVTAGRWSHDALRYYVRDEVFQIAPGECRRHRISFATTT